MLAQDEPLRAQASGAQRGVMSRTLRLHLIRINRMHLPNSQLWRNRPLSFQEWCLCNGHNRRGALRPSLPMSNFPHFGGEDEAPGVEVQQYPNLKNQVPLFMDYAKPRPFDDAHFIKSEGGIDWVRGVELMSGGAKSLKVICDGHNAAEE